MITYGGKERVESLRGRLKGKILSDAPGYYKWWASEEDFERLLSALDVYDKDRCKQLAERNEAGQYCIYIGIALKESIHSRFGWHINQNHTPSAIKYRTLSTLRQSLSALLCSDMNAKEETNVFMDRLSVEWWSSDYAVKTHAAKQEIKAIESAALSAKGDLYILNIQENMNQAAIQIKKELKNRRSDARKRAMEEWQKTESVGRETK